MGIWFIACRLNILTNIAFFDTIFVNNTYIFDSFLQLFLGEIIMKIAALGDIHSNHFALEACLEYIYKSDFDGIAFLGDYVTDCPYPQKTIQTIKSIPNKYMTWFVRGNREDCLIDYSKHSQGWTYGSKFGSLLYSYENLSSEDITCFEKMPLFININIAGCKPFTICHGSLEDNRIAILPNTEEIKDAIDNMTTNLLICAHSHTPFIYTKNNKCIVNGGAVGISVNNQTDAQFIVVEYENNDWMYSQVNVKYDIESAVDEFYESGFIDKANVWAKAILNTLKTGRDYAVECLDLVDKYSAKSEFDIASEILWKKADKELFLD